MADIQTIIQNINQDFSTKAEVRDRTLRRSRELISHCAKAIQATHRVDEAEAERLLTIAQDIAQDMIDQAKQFPDVYYAGYTQDALKELAEAHLVRALILQKPLPTPQTLNIENAAYVNGLAEAVGELRRHTLDALRRGQVERGEYILSLMDEIYIELMTVDFPSAITHGLRRNIDMVRGVTERTRGDVTTAVRQEAMKKALAVFKERVKED